MERNEAFALANEMRRNPVFKSSDIVMLTQDEGLLETAKNINLQLIAGVKYTINRVEVVDPVYRYEANDYYPPTTLVWLIGINSAFGYEWFVKS